MIKEYLISHINSGLWSRSRWSRMFSAGVGVGFFKTAGVGVGFLKLLESKSVFQNCWSRNICCNYRLQCSLNNLNYNINCLKIITGYWQY